MAERQVLMLGRHGHLATLAESYVARASHEAGAAAGMAASHKEGKYVLTIF